MGRQEESNRKADMDEAKLVNCNSIRALCECLANSHLSDKKVVICHKFRTGRKDLWDLQPEDS